MDKGTKHCLNLEEKKRWENRVNFSNVSCNDRSMCLGATRHFVKSSTRLCSSALKRPTNVWPSNLLGNPWLWNPHFTSTFHPRPSFNNVDLFLNGQSHFFEALCVELLTRLYRPPLSQPKINLLLLPLFSVSVSDLVMVTITLFLILISLAQLTTASLVSNLCVVVNAAVVCLHMVDLYHIIKVCL